EFRISIFHTEIVNQLTSHAQLNFPARHIEVHQQLCIRNNMSCPFPINYDDTFGNICNLLPHLRERSSIEKRVDCKFCNKAKNPVISHVGIYHLCNLLGRLERIRSTNKGIVRQKLSKGVLNLIMKYSVVAINCHDNTPSETFYMLI